MGDRRQFGLLKWVTGKNYFLRAGRALRGTVGVRGWLESPHPINLFLRISVPANVFIILALTVPLTSVLLHRFFLDNGVSRSLSTSVV